MRAAIFAVLLTGCASWPAVRPYTYDDATRAGEELCAGVSRAASSRASAHFGWGIAASVVGAAGLATLAAVPDRNLVVEKVPGSATRAGISTLAGGLVALGVYLALGASDADALAAAAKNAMLFGEGEEPGPERDRAAWSLCLDAWGAYDDAGAARRSQWPELGAQ